MKKVISVSSRRPWHWELQPLMAQTKPSVHFNHWAIKIGNNQVSVKGFAHKDGSTLMTFMPVRYVMRGLKDLRFTVNWDGQKKNLQITALNGVTTNTSNVKAGSGSASV